VPATTQPHGITRHRGGAFELNLTLGMAVEFLQKITAHARQQMTLLERALGHKSINELKSRRGLKCHGHRYSPRKKF